MRNNKGFSLVELIIVIAIMAILSAALAPQLMKYIEKARVSADAQTCAAIEGCVNAALTNENVWNDMGLYRTGKFKFYIRMSDDGSQMLIQGLQGGDNSDTELRENIKNLKNPKQTGMHSYMVLVESIKKIEDGKETHCIGSIEVSTSDYHFNNNKDGAIY